MKRNEMVKLISDKIGYDFTYCSAILEVVEKAGMLPPRNPHITFAQQAEHKTLHIWEEA